MARLPTREDFGATPTPSVRGAAQVGSTPDLGIEDVGRSFSVVGDALQKAQHHSDKIRAEDAFNKLQQKKLELTDRFKQVKSGDVFEQKLYKTYDEEFNKAVNEFSEKLDNDQQKGFFKRRSDVSRLQYGADLTNHIRKESDIYSKQVTLSGKELEKQSAISHWDEPGSIKLAIERSNRLTDDQADREGLPTSVVKLQKLKDTSDIHLGVVNQAIATDNPEYAKEWFKKNKKDIDATQHPKIEDLIRKSDIKVHSQEISDDIMVRGLDEKTALAEVRKKYKGEEEAAFLKSVKDRFAEQDRIQDDIEKSASEDAWNIYAETGDFDQIPLNTLEEMKGKNREALRAYADKQKTGTPTKTNYQVYYGLVDMAKNDPAQFKSLNMMEYLPYLDDAHKDQLIKLQTERTEIDYVQSQNELAKNAARKAGLDLKAKPDSSKGQAVAQFYDSLNTQLTAFQTVKGRKPDDKELTEITDRMIKDKVMVDEWFSDPEKPVSTLTVEDLKDAYVEVEGQEVKLIDIPDQHRAEIIQRLVKSGLPVSEKAIARKWLILTGKI